jgi:ABC-2 type transport system permease protein
LEIHSEVKARAKAPCPLYYFIDASYGILLRGAGLDIVWDSMAGMTLLGGLALGLGMWRFRRQF